MGDCLITRRGGDSYKLPILDENYPQDVSVSVIKGNTTRATFNVMIAEPGSPAVYTYQWYVNGSPVIGATSSSYTRSGLSATATYNVYCEVTNKKGTVTSRIATLDVVQQYAPVLDASYPQDGIAEVGVALTSKVVIATAGNPAPTYQWYKNGVAVSGANSDTYTFTPDAVGSFTLYCEVTNAAGKVTSRTANFSTRLYLYKAGNECTTVTGGWNAGSFIYQNTSSGDDAYKALPPIKNATNMVFKSNYTTRGKFDGVFTKKIDLYSCNKLCADINVDSLYDGASRFVLRTLTGYNIYNSNAGSAGSGNSTGRKTITLNVSSLYNSYYIGMTMNFTSKENKSDQTTVFNVWLE